jgi:hypothetical protein
MIRPEVLGHSNVAARDQSREFFNNIGGFRTFPKSACAPRRQNGAHISFYEAYGASAVLPSFASERPHPRLSLGQILGWTGIWTMSLKMTL